MDTALFFLSTYHAEEELLLCRVVIRDKTWVYHYTLGIETFVDAVG